MSIKIHHATAKKAEKIGIELKIEDGMVCAYHEEDLLAEGPSASQVLSEAEEKLKTGDEEAEEAEGTEDDGEATEDASEDEDDAPRGYIKRKYRDLYASMGHPDTCGDEMADELKAATTDGEGKMDMDVLRHIGAQNDIDVDARWGHLNNGMARMNLSNVLRGRIRKGEAVQIGERTIQIDPEAEDAA